MTYSTRGMARLARIRTGSVAGDIGILMLMLTLAWAVIGWHALTARVARLSIQVPFWAVVVCVWPFSWLLRIIGILPARPDPLTGFLDSSLMVSAFLAFLLRERRERKVKQREWVEQKAARRLRRGDVPQLAAEAPHAARECNLSQFNAVRLDDLDQRFAKMEAMAGEFLWIAREAGARAGIAPYEPEQPASPWVPKVIRGGEAS